MLQLDICEFVELPASHTSGMIVDRLASVLGMIVDRLASVQINSHGSGRQAAHRSCPLPQQPRPLPLHSGQLLPPPRPLRLRRCCLCHSSTISIFVSGCPPDCVLLRGRQSQSFFSDTLQCQASRAQQPNQANPAATCLSFLQQQQPPRRLRHRC